MINYPYQYARTRVAKQRRAKTRQFITLGFALFALFAIASTMSFNDCLLGVC